MITITFLLIAYLMRNKFLPEGISINIKIWYYVFCVSFTPVIGPFIFKLLLEQISADDDSDESSPFLGDIDDL